MFIFAHHKGKVLQKNKIILIVVWEGMVCPCLLLRETYQRLNGGICPSLWIIRESGFNEGEAKDNKENKPLNFVIALSFIFFFEFSLRNLKLQ